jgi:ring-1,2-phenylacetyl-CoA epoxidase subunit PaaD
MDTKVKYSKKEILSLLGQIPDPEIPVISISELGILRDVEIKGDLVTVDITPTYSGCPAMKMIEDQVREELHRIGVEKVQVNHVFTPAWTTDWLTEEAKDKLRKFGIAPPEKTTSDKNILTGKSKVVTCPHCGSQHTEMISQFGSTACKALYRCLNCREPFDHFKCH